MKLSGRLLLLLVGLAPLGCGQRDEITRYQVAKEAKKAVPPVVTPSAQPARMLGAIVPRGAKTWFFKLTGPPTEVAEHKSAFDELLASLTFTADEPGWKEPAGWRRQPGDGFRYASLKLAAAPGIDVSISSLPSVEGEDPVEYALKNINRWRGQLGLPPATKEELSVEKSDVAQSRTIAGGEALVIDFEGMMTGSGMGRSPIQGTAPVAIPDPGEQPGGTQPDDSGPLTFKRPDGWSPGETSQLRKASFVVRTDGQQVDVTVIDLPAAANDLLSNVNRWRGQVGLAPIADDELQQAVMNVPLAEGEGSFVELIAPADAPKQQTILGVVAVNDDKAWFVKLQGDSPLAAREKEHFLEFVKSLKFNP